MIRVALMSELNLYALLIEVCGLRRSEALAPGASVGVSNPSNHHVS